MPRRISLVVSGCVRSGPQNNPGEFWFYELAGIFVQEGVEMDRSAARKARGSDAAGALQTARTGPDASPAAVPAATAPAPPVTAVSYQPRLTGCTCFARMTGERFGYTRSAFGYGTRRDRVVV